MASKLELLERTMDRGFPLGEDVPSALADPVRVESLRTALAELATEDFAVEMVGDEGFRRERHGSDGFLEAWRDWVEPFKSFRVELDEILESGPHVVTLVRQIGTPRGGEQEIENEGAAVWTFEGDRVVRVEFHMDREVAKRAAGVQPQSRQE
jgi:ketosteroid isomerase-like protein